MRSISHDTRSVRGATFEYLSLDALSDMAQLGTPNSMELDEINICSMSSISLADNFSEVSSSLDFI
jgi:hypothetical protein